MTSNGYLQHYCLVLCLFASVSYAATQGEPAKHLRLADAVSRALKSNTEILVDEENVSIACGGLQVQRGEFDWVFNAGYSYTDEDSPLTEDVRDSTGFSRQSYTINSMNASFSKKLRSGISFGPAVNRSQTIDGTLGLDRVDETSADLVLTIPLFKGRGADATAGAETAARLGVESAKLSLRHTASRSTLGAAKGFWSYLSANEQLAILKQAESRAEQIVNDVKKLVDGGQRPASDLDQLVANQADKARARIGGEQQLVTARQSLGLLMGVDAEEVMKLPLPEGLFPELPAKMDALSIDTTAAVDAAIEQRADFAASAKDMEAAKAIYESSILLKRHKLDLVLTAGYKDKDSGSNPPLYADQGEYTAVGAIKYELPLGNNRYRGQYLQARARFAQVRLQHLNTERNIRSGIHVAIDGLRRSALRLAKAREAVAFYKKAVDNEMQKLRMGMSTVIDVVTVEDLLRNAQLSEVSGRQEYAEAIANLRYEAGDLVSVSNDTIRVDEKALLEVPFYGGN